MSYNDVDVVGEALSNRADIENGKEDNKNGSTFMTILAVAISAFMLAFLLYVPLAAYRGTQTSPFFEKNDYRICEQDGNPRTSKLIRFDTGSEIPDGCTMRLDYYDRILEVGDTLDNWAWAAYNAHGQGTLQHPDEAPIIRYFRQYDQIVNLLSTIRKHKLMRACDGLVGVEQLKCIWNVPAEAGMDWNWAESEEIKDV